MKLIKDDYQLSENDIEQFHRNGFLLLKGIFSNDFISNLFNKISDDIEVPVDRYQSGFNRIKFDLLKGDENINLLMRSKSFRKTMRDLTKRPLIYSQALGFELKKNESKGFPWHIGTQSFGYQRAEDFGCTIWTPLVPINTKKQRGGMAYVPKDGYQLKMGRFEAPASRLKIKNW